MGLLDNILSSIDAKKRTFKRSIMDMLDNPSDWSNMAAARMKENMYGGPENWDAMKRYYQQQPYDQKLKDAAQQSMINNSVNESLGAVTAWHGSPHKFDKFDMSKIGTGEGAQAYGHGLYLAESPSVAKEYASANAGRAAASEGAIDSLPKPMQMEVFKAMQMKDGPFKKAAIDDILQRYPEAEGVVKSKSPTLYKVDIPDEAVARFLDWDKPLSQQAPEVRAAIGKMRDQFPISKNGWDIKPWMDADPLASTWHNEAVRELGLGQDYFTKHLSESGVPGIRYLDGGSRGTGQGTSNYVLFDDQMPRILERNGQPTGLQPWAKGEWKGLLDEPAPKLTEFDKAQKSFNDLSAQVESAKSAFSSDRSRANLNEYNRLLQARDDAQSIMQQWQPKSSEIPVDYKGQHSAPMKDSGAPLHDITKGGYYPDDVYGVNGLQYYGTGNDNLDRAAYSVIRGAKGNPTAQVKMYRAVPNDAPNVINNGDWVTTVRQYAKEHGDSALNGDYRIVSKTVPAKKLFTNGDSWLEFGYDESGKIDPRLLGAMGAGGLLGMGGYSMMNDK